MYLGKCVGALALLSEYIVVPHTFFSILFLPDEFFLMAKII